MLEGVSREAGPFEFVVCADGARVPRTVRVGPDCARGPVDDGVRVPGTVRACPGLCAWAGGWARVPRTVRAGPFAGGLNPLMRSWALLVAVWAACLDYHLWG